VCSGGRCRSLHCGRDDKVEATLLLEGDAGPSTSLRSGRDDNS
jgi:hypothetical protein